MADQDLADLRDARRVLVEMRRDWVRTLKSSYQLGKTEDAIRGVVDAQAAIEAIDRAILDEGKLLSEGK